MSDPLSVAVGIISLGIQVTEKIVLYCVSWKGYNKDIEDFNHKASGLSQTLKHLEDVLQRQQNLDSSSQKQIEDLMDVSKITFDKLKEMTDKIPPPSSGSKAAFAKRAVYPLRKQALADAAGMVDSLQANVNTALSVLLLHQGTVAHNALSQDLHTRNFILQDKLERMESMIRHLVDNRLQVAPSLLQSMQDENRHAMPALRCSSAYALGRRQQQFHVLDKKIRLHSRLLRFSLTLALSITKGAGDCSIAPTLTYQGITAQDFGPLMREYFRTAPALERNYLQCCQYLIEKRIIRPFDRQLNGATLLQEVCIYMSIWRYGVEERHDPSQKVIRYLIKAGVPVNNSDHTNLDFFFYHLEAEQLSHPAISILIDAGDYLTDKGLSPYNRKAIQYFILHHPEAVYISSAARALVQEDEETFSRIVRQDQLSGNDIIGYYKAIELAIGWPSGIKTLLDAGMDSIPPSTLIFATNLGCVSSLKLLLEASFVLTSTNIGIIVTKAKNGEMDLLIDEIILRRTKIRDLAISCLPEHKWRGIGISRESLPDLIVPKVYETLRAEGVDIPKRLRPLWYSQDLLDLDGELQVGKPCIYFVFHSLYLPVQYMQRLYDAGLTDVDEPDSDGFTPLMCKWGAQSPKELCFWGAQSPAQLFGRARWLVSKGADSSRPLPGTGIPALHTIVNTGILLSHWKIPEILSKASVNKPLANLDRHDLLFLRKAIAENQPDACKCNCSTNGCTPLSLSLKNLGWSIWQKDSNPIVLTISELLHLLPPSSTIMETVIRLMVFEDLDLTHTCCDTDYLPPFDQDETKAIHEEEEQCLSELEQLVDEFMDLYNKLNQPLLQFLQEHWCPRMQEYLQQAQPLSEEELSKTREIGVELSPTCPLRSDAWCVLLQPKITETEELGQSDDSEP